MNEIQRSISLIIKGYTIYLITSIATVIIATLVVIAIIGSGLFESLDASTLTSLNIIQLFGGLMAYLLLLLATMIVMLYGNFLTYKGLKLLAPQLDEKGKAGATNLSIAMLITIISSVVAFVPVIGGFAALAGNITAIVFSFMGYSALRESLSLNEAGRNAAKQLFNSMVFYVIMIGCAITIIGLIAVPVLYVLYWVYLFNGWKNLRTSFATCDREIHNQ